MLAVVGTRRITPYGRAVLTDIIPAISQAGITIVSGLAIGIDAQAHRQTLNAGGITVAVLASGVDMITPPRNEPLAREILEKNGTIISEYEPGTDARPYHFPVRNRLLSGLALGTLVIEAAEKSGSLITAHSALEQNRDVFAVPGDIFRETSGGPNALIRAGAIPVRSADDILTALNVPHSSTKNTMQQNALVPRPRSPIEEKLLPHLTRSPQALDLLVRASGLSAAEVSQTLAILELVGAAERTPEGLFRITQHSTNS